jgi:hypothetical protein
MQFNLIEIVTESNMDKTKLLMVVAVQFVLFSAGVEAKLYKWVDDKGEIHYGEVIPPEYADKQRVQFDDKGREVKKQDKPKDTISKAVAKTPAELEQERRDQALLGTFSSESEIDLARDRNLQQVNAHISSVTMRLKTAQDDLDGYQKEKDAMVKAAKPVNKILQEQIDDATAKLAKLQNELTKTQAEEAAITARYSADKQRFHELTAGKAEQKK